MIRWILYIVLLIGFIGAIIYGYQEHQEKNAVLIQAENNYQRAFHDLTYRIDLLNEKIGTVMAMNTPENLSPQLTEIWKISSEAQADVGQLPLTLLPFNKTEEFLSNIGEFSYRVAIRGLDENPLNDDEKQLLSELHDSSNEIKRELRTVQHEVLDQGLRWMDVEVALATNEPGDNTIVDGLQTIEKNTEQFNSNDNEGVFTLDNKTNKEEIKFDGRTYDESEIKDLVREQFELENDIELNVTETGEGSDIPMYNVSFDTGDLHGYAEVTQQGGNMISYMLTRDMGEAEIGLNEAMNQAQDLLSGLGYEEIQMVESSQYEKVGVFRFVREEDGVLYYPDSLQVKVALDEGDIVGLTARDYIINTTAREDVDFTENISEEEAEEYVNPNIEIMETRKAVIENDLGDEVLCYELIGTLNDQTYRVYINTSDGFEEKVERLQQSEEIYGMD
ncbi:germination protein YpeB [Aquisalibacillus elongatus]|uniref:Spore germination protein n=1 Tax=Aquisalibacillus elongatus TaxID=485577 RepID=A0A3N5BE61_9BACI|nr:germination protein YpeB [Aquisalibacillus elongatus]RPF55753.1 spore germination protein [Aquisalibacillus elongatus]